MFSTISEVLDDFLTFSAQQQKTIALALIKFDSIEGINQQYGYAITDQALNICYGRLAKISKADGCLHRLEGNKFALILPQLTNEIIVDLAAAKLEISLAPIYQVSNHEFFLPPKIGISHTNNPEQTATELYASTEKALKEARQCSSNVVIHSCTKSIPTSPIKDLHSVMRKAIENNQFELYLQPKIDMQTGQCASFETLIRWKNNGQNIPPDVFISYAETCELIFPITKWTINNALRQLRSLKPPFDNLSASVNISAACFREGNLIHEVSNALSIWNIEPSRLILEITETAIMNDLSHTQEICNTLRSELGVRVSIDDFGTGFSGFEFFKEIVADELKIDRSFISNVANSSREQNIVKCLVGLAHGIGATVVAEGIEDQASLIVLADLEVDYAQGYFISKPFPEKELNSWLENYTPLL